MNFCFSCSFGRHTKVANRFILYFSDLFLCKSIAKIALFNYFKLKNNSILVSFLSAHNVTFVYQVSWVENFQESQEACDLVRDYTKIPT